nr:MAG TPA: hypothetical protein [Caudoviricetes sp.]
MENYRKKFLGLKNRKEALLLGALLSDYGYIVRPNA